MQLSFGAKKTFSSKLEPRQRGPQPPHLNGMKWCRKYQAKQPDKEHTPSQTWVQLQVMKSIQESQRPTSSTNQGPLEEAMKHLIQKEGENASCRYERNETYPRLLKEKAKLL